MSFEMSSRLSILWRTVALPTRRLVASRYTDSVVAEVLPAPLVFLGDYSIPLTTSELQQELRGQAGQFLWQASGRIGTTTLSDHHAALAQIVPKSAAASRTRPIGVRAHAQRWLSSYPESISNSPSG
jgi:hypothetical protein